jgi:CRISPR-associated protein Cmr6
MHSSLKGVPSRRMVIEEKMQGAPQNQVAHAGLWLDKYPTSILRKGDADKLKKDEVAPNVQVMEEATRVAIPRLYWDYLARWESLWAAPEARMGIATAQGPVVVGLGSESVLETAITLHHTYGVPYLPGSALKGLAAHYAHLRLEDSAWRIGSSAHRELFGDTTLSGVVTFWDAPLYVSPSRRRNIVPSPLRKDVMTVHHREYYGNERDAAPTDFDQPNPIPFLSIKPQTEFRVVLTGSAGWLEAAWDILTLALQEFGIGAKTSSGYGRMHLRVLAA